MRRPAYSRSHASRARCAAAGSRRSSSRRRAGGSRTCRAPGAARPARGSAARCRCCVSRSSAPNSFSRSRSSTTHRDAVPAGRLQRERRRLLGAHVRRAQQRVVARARVRAHQRPSAAAWRSPSAESGTSQSRLLMSMIAAPLASARSRATLPALSACRIRTSSAGQPISTQQGRTQIRRARRTSSVASSRSSPLAWTRTVSNMASAIAWALRPRLATRSAESRSMV